MVSGSGGGDQVSSPVTCPRGNQAATPWPALILSHLLVGVVTGAMLKLSDTRGKACGERRGRVAVHENGIGLPIVEDLADGLQDARRQIAERLAFAHQIEIVVGRDIEQVQHLIEHLPMLCGDAYFRVDVRLVGQRFD